MKNHQIVLSIAMLISGRKEMKQSLDSLKSLMEAIPSELILVDTGCSKEYRELAEALNTALKMPQIIDQALQMQKNAALTAQKEDYRPIVE